MMVRVHIDSDVIMDSMEHQPTTTTRCTATIKLYGWIMVLILKETARPGARKRSASSYGTGEELMLLNGYSIV